MLHDQVRDPIGRLGRGEMGDAVEHYEPPGLDAAGDVLKDRGGENAVVVPGHGEYGSRDLGQAAPDIENRQRLARRGVAGGVGSGVGSG